jgi:Tfp pilus assembly protein PilN
MIEINLIPDVKQELLNAQRTRAAVISISITAGIIALGVVALLVAYIFLFQGGRHYLLDQDIKTKSAELSNVEDLSKILTLQNQLTKIDELNKTKKIDSRVFDMLQAVVPPNQITISSLRMNTESKTINVEGRSKTYGNVEIFKKTLEGAIVVYTENDAEQTKPLASSVNIDSISFAEDEVGQRIVRFGITFKYDESLFSANYPSIVIRLSNQGNVTDSYLGIPRSVFVEGGTN